MVRPNFVQQSVPRPNAWEPPTTYSQPSDYWVQPAGDINPTPQRLLQHIHAYIGAVQRYEEFINHIQDFSGTQQWEAHHLLGDIDDRSTSGLWQLRDENGDIRDEVVVKEPSIIFPNQWNRLWRLSGTQARYDILHEAIMQTTLNASGCENFLHLRGYKFVCNDPAPALSSLRDTRMVFEPFKSAATRKVPQTWPLRQAPPLQLLPNFGAVHRMYLEYAPYGSLKTLLDRYRAWSQYLPEPFLWHIFHSLLLAARTMRQSPQVPQIGTWVPRFPDNDQIIHLRIEPENILLGYEKPMNETSTATGGSKKLPYPIVKLRDFTEAELTGVRDKFNPMRMWNMGKRYFRAPEQIHYGVNFEVPPNGPYRPLIDPSGDYHNIVLEEEQSSDPGFKFLDSVHVWTIGKIMYDLATMSYENSFQLRWNWRESEYKNDNRQLLFDFHSVPFRFPSTGPWTGPPGYSRHLMDLVSQCLMPKIDDRITLDDLIDAVEAQLNAADNDIDMEDDEQNATRARNDVKRRRLYYRDVEINDMPMGNAPFQNPQYNEEGRLMDQRWVDPDVPPLQLPVAKFYPERIVDPTLHVPPRPVPGLPSDHNSDSDWADWNDNNDGSDGGDNGGGGGGAGGTSGGNVGNDGSHNDSSNQNRSDSRHSDDANNGGNSGSNSRHTNSNNGSHDGNDDGNGDDDGDPAGTQLQAQLQAQLTQLASDALQQFQQLPQQPSPSRSPSLPPLQVAPGAGMPSLPSGSAAPQSRSTQSPADRPPQQSPASRAPASSPRAPPPAQAPPVRRSARIAARATTATTSSPSLAPQPATRGRGTNRGARGRGRGRAVAAATPQGVVKSGKGGRGRGRGRGKGAG